MILKTPDVTQKAPSAVKSVLLVLVAAAKDKEYLEKGRHASSRGRSQVTPKASFCWPTPQHTKHCTGEITIASHRFHISATAVTLL